MGTRGITWVHHAPTHTYHLHMHAHAQILLKAPQCAFLYSYCRLRLFNSISMDFISFIMEPGRIFTCTPHTSNISIGVSFTLKGYNVQDLGPERDCHDQASWGRIYTLHGLPLSWRYWSTVFVKIMRTWLSYTLHPTFIAAALSGTQATSWAFRQHDCGAPANKKIKWFHWCTQAFKCI